MSKRAEEAVYKAYPLYDNDRYSYLRNALRIGYQQGYEQAEKDTIERAIKWLIDRIDVSCSVSTNENGEPLADSYIDYAEKRLEAANKIVDEFRKAMEEE